MRRKYCDESYKFQPVTSEGVVLVLSIYHCLLDSSEKPIIVIVIGERIKTTYITETFGIALKSFSSLKQGLLTEQFALEHLLMLPGK